jgi:Ser/Thr protein kinase RdoA (MazF antagonist)
LVWTEVGVQSDDERPMADDFDFETDVDAAAMDAGSETFHDGTAVGLPSPSTVDSEAGDRATFEPSELRTVLEAFPVTLVREIREFPAGSRQAPKVRVVASEGEFLLKRRVARTELVARAIFNHRLLLHLEAAGVPVARLVGTVRGNRSMLLMGDRVYELFEWVDGRRMVKAAPEVRHAARVLGRIHREGTGLSVDDPPLLAGYHASETVETAFARLEKAIVTADPDVDRSALRVTLTDLRRRRDDALEAVENAGWRTAPVQPIHGDWHPGNVLFTPERPTQRHPGVVRAVIDFDSSRLEPRLVDVANGLLHFAMRSDGTRSPAEWPPSLSGDRIRAFLAGWLETAGPILPHEPAMLAPLMIEGLVAESVVPIARNGTFARVPGGPFLEMVRRKAIWIERNAAALRRLLERADGPGSRSPG